MKLKNFLSPWCWVYAETRFCQKGEQLIQIHGPAVKIPWSRAILQAARQTTSLIRTRHRAEHAQAQTTDDVAQKALVPAKHHIKEEGGE